MQNTISSDTTGKQKGKVFHKDYMQKTATSNITTSLLSFRTFPASCPVHPVLCDHWPNGREVYIMLCIDLVLVLWNFGTALTDLYMRGLNYTLLLQSQMNTDDEEGILPCFS